MSPGHQVARWVGRSKQCKKLKDFRKFQYRFKDFQGPSDDFQGLQDNPLSRLFQALNLFFPIQGFSRPHRPHLIIKANQSASLLHTNQRLCIKKCLFYSLIEIFLCFVGHFQLAIFIDKVGITTIRFIGQQ